MSDVPAHWDQVTKAVEIRNKMKSATLILGNGDVQSAEEAKAKAAETGVDGIMLGRGIFGNPWLFGRLPGQGEKLKVMLEHTRLFEELFAGKKNFDVMKKHYKAYVTGWDGARELRARLMETKTAAEVAAVLEYDYAKNSQKNH